MLSTINWFIVTLLYWFLRLCRLPVVNSPRLFALLGTRRLQPLLAHWGRRRALDVARLAQKRCPAYRDFLAKRNFTRIRAMRDFAALPLTDKPTYIKAYSIEQRCLHGRIPTKGVVIDESSGSSGEPNNWVRGPAERAAVKRLLRHGVELTYHDQSIFLLNCFALGPWATGMNVSMSLADSVILKSIGPDRDKLESTLRTFGPDYHYAVAGYPPFIKDFIDSTALDLAPYDMRLIVGGEGISEGLRDRFLEVFKSVRSSYGASDLEINIAAETDRSVALRRLAHEDPELCEALFGRTDPPMVFQYNPLDYLVEQSPDGELVFTLLRHHNAAPKVRYNLRDLGGAFPYARAEQILRDHGHAPSALPAGFFFPFLYVFGRSDLTIPFYGAKVSPADLEAVINESPDLRAHFNAFQMTTRHDEHHNEILLVALERARSAEAASDPDDTPRRLYEALARVNQDFREVSKMFTPDRIRVTIHPFAEGPFADRDIRIKNRYIAPDPS